MSFWSATTLVFFVLDPFGNVPKVLCTLSGAPLRKRERVLIRELVIALAVIIMFLFLGREVLMLMHLSQEALSVGGGVLLFLIAVRMIFPPADKGGQSEDEDPFVVPVAIPYIAGPATLATVMVMGTNEPDRWPTWLGAVIVAWCAAGIIMIVGNRLADLIGKRGLIALERLMGMILIAIAVEMLFRGIRMFLASVA
ncbi:MAG: MarC family protein [Phycisphaerae bacterium]